ncbi:MAG: arylsulfatase [Verrucomicrobiota bacterium]
MTKRVFTLLLALAFLPFSSLAEAPRPNVIFILCDDLGYGDLGSFGQEDILTPHLDEMAGEGLVFTQHYSGSTVCAPSRSCLLTGKHTGNTYLRGNGDFALRPDPLDFTIGALMREAGYDTCLIGKNCTSGDVPADFSLPNKKGFDHFFGVLGHREAHHYHPPRVYRNGEAIDLPGNHLHEGEYFAPDLYLAEAVEWLNDEARNEKPFFLLYSAPAPHASLSAPEEWIAKYRGKFPERSVPEKHYRGTEEPNATFAAMISRLDWEVGQLIETVEAIGASEDTLILFASDNGAQSAGGHQESDFNSSGPLRGEKRDLYEGGIRTPLLARWPGTIEAGRRSNHVSAFWDLMPTLAELAGVEAPEDIDGISYAPTLLDKPEEQEEHDYLYWEFFEKGGKRAVRFADWKAVQLDLMKKGGPRAVELYNLREDLAETTNLAEKHPDKIAKAKEIFETARSESPIEKFNFPSNNP